MHHEANFLAPFFIASLHYSLQLPSHSMLMQSPVMDNFQAPQSKAQEAVIKDCFAIVFSYKVHFVSCL